MIKFTDVNVLRSLNLNKAEIYARGIDVGREPRESSRLVPHLRLQFLEEVLDDDQLVRYARTKPTRSMSKTVPPKNAMAEPEMCGHPLSYARRNAKLALTAVLI